MLGLFLGLMALSVPIKGNALQESFIAHCQNPSSDSVKVTTDFLMNYVKASDCTSAQDSLAKLTVIESWEAKGVSDLRPLAEFDQLEELTLANSGELVDLSPLAALKNLRKLNLHAGGKIQSGLPLVTLTFLKELDLSGNEISDLSFLSSLTQLESLNLGENRIKDLGKIENLKSLAILHLFDQKGIEGSLESIDALASLNKLKTLNIRGNSIHDLSVLYRLSGLSELQASGNTAPVDVRKLVEGHPNLAKLTLSGKAIFNVQDVGRLEKLYWLGLSDGAVSDSDLAAILANELPNLSVLTLERDELTDLSPLATRKLSMLFLNHNQIRDLTPLKDMADLVWLMAEENAIQDVSPLSGLASVRFLSLDSNPIVADERHCPTTSASAPLNAFCKYYLENR